MTISNVTPEMLQSGTRIGTAASGTKPPSLADRLRQMVGNPGDIQNLQNSVFSSDFGPWEAQPVRAGLALAGDLTARQDRQSDDIRGFLMGARDQRNRAQAGAGDLSLKFGQAADMATGQSLDNWRGLSDYLGGAGITGGGLAAGLGAQIELQRMGQISNAQRDISIAEADRRARQASDNFLQDLGLGSFLKNDLGPSSTLLDQINGTAGWALDYTLGNRQIDAAERASERASADAKKNRLASLISGGLGLAGALL